MRKTILILLGAGFAAYTLAVYAAGTPSGGQEPTVEATKGWRLWQEKNCQGCHQLYGLGGYMGPDLTNAASQKGAAYMYPFIRYGTGKMPQMGLDEVEIRQLIAFLSWVDQSGKSKVPQSSVHWSGSYKNVE